MLSPSALFFREMVCFVRQALVKEAKFISIENNLQLITRKNGNVVSQGRHLLGNRLCLSRNSLERYAIPVKEEGRTVTLCNRNYMTSQRIKNSQLYETVIFTF